MIARVNCDKCEWTVKSSKPEGYHNKNCPACGGGPLITGDELKILKEIRKAEEAKIIQTFDGADRCKSGMSVHIDTGKLTGRGQGER